MNKSKLAVGLMTAVLSAGALAGCDNTVKYSSTGTILTYLDGDKQEHKITADDLLVDYYDDSSKYQSIFDTIKSIVVRNYFTFDDSVVYQGNTVPLGKKQMEQINSDANFKVEADKKTAKTNADNNGTSYSDEFDSILSSKGVDTEEDLFQKYVEELQAETFDENFYKYYVEDIKNGKKLPSEEGTEKQMWTGYFADMKPYHVSHILVKLEDGSSTNYANGTISEANAKKLYDVVNLLKTGEDSFGSLARRFSEDTGSAMNYGDLGIMDYSTGYVNEFKLSVYAYENLLGDHAAEAKGSVIGIPGAATLSGLAKDYADEVESSFGGFPEIPYSVFVDLKDNADKVKDADGKAVIEDSANFYPRNIIYNKYLNRHSFALITDTAESANVDSHTTGFKAMSINGATKNVLAVKIAGEWTPVLAARAGSDYQGIHFIVVNRSPFVATDGNGVSLSEYYTTFYPEQEGYPVAVDTEGKKTPKKTYVNYSSKEVSDTKSRAEGFKSTLKSFDSDRLNKYIFQKYFEFEGVQISDEKLEETLNKWISRGFEKKAQEQQESWEKTWRDYIQTLSKQNSERTKLVSEACKIAYLNGNNSAKLTEVELEPGVSYYAAMKAFLEAEGHAADVEEYLGTQANSKTFVELFKTEGGLCNDGKAHF